MSGLRCVVCRQPRGKRVLGQRLFDDVYQLCRRCEDNLAAQPSWCPDERVVIWAARRAWRAATKAAQERERRRYGEGYQLSGSAS